MIRFLILVSNLTLLDFVILGDCVFSKHIYLENGIFKICFRQSAKCKMTAQTGRKFHVFVKICNLHCILQSKLRFSSSDHFFVFSVQLIHFTRGVFPVYTIYIQYIQYILYNRSNISIDSKNYVS